MLAVSDEVNDALVADPTAVRGAQLILACGDLPFEYLGALMNVLDVPLVFVPGNHDPDVSGYRLSRAGPTLRAGLPVRPGRLGRTAVRNVTGWHLLGIEPGVGLAELLPGRRDAR